MKAVGLVGLALTLCALTTLSPMSAQADHLHYGRHHHAGWGIWGGWAAPRPLFYYNPVYTYPVAPTSTIIVEKSAPIAQPVQPQQQYWYYCESTRNYFPYVATCQEEWKMVPPTPPLQ